MAWFRRVVIALLATAVVGGALTVGIMTLYGYQKRPLPLEDQCVARVAELSVAIDTEQAYNAAIIAGVAGRRGLAPRAATIGLATAYQESGLYNLDYGDRDSLGLFQQRPSQGWGSASQVQDPWYASNRFYAALVKIPNWQTGDVNDVAQAVQRSGHPQGYRRHVENARRIASALSGETPASFGCLVKNPPTPDAAGFAAFARKTLPASFAVSVRGTTVTVKAPTNRGAWAAAETAIATQSRFGATRVSVGDQSWTPSPTEVATWTGTKRNVVRAVIEFGVANPTASPSR